jgi:hypothetical protein
MRSKRPFDTRTGVPGNFGIRSGIIGMSPRNSTAPASVSDHARSMVDAMLAPSANPTAITSRASKR